MIRKKQLLLVALAAALLAGCVYKPKLPPLAEKRPAEKPLLITNAMIFTGDPNLPFLEKANILVENGKITRLGDVLPPLAAVERIDATGKMVIPGLIDHHIHIGSPGAPPGFLVLPDETLLDRNLSAYLFAGVTTVFDMASSLPEIEALKQRVEAGNRVNPRLFYAGKCLNTKGGHPDYMFRSMLPWPIDAIAINKVMFPVSDTADIQDAIRQNKEHGASLTKIMVDQIPMGVPALQEDLITPIVAESMAAGLTVGSHVGSEADIITGLNSGVRFFAHAPYRSSLSNGTIQRMKAAGAVVIPTLVVFEYMTDFFLHSLDFTEMDKKIMDPAVQKAYAETKPEKKDLKDPRLAAWVHDLITYRDIKFDNVRRIKQAGITIIAGTDSPNLATAPGSSLHTELRLLVEKCGFTPEEAVMTATGVSGKWLETLTGVKGLGRVAENGPADLLILNKDFRKDIRQTENIYMVIASGKVVDRR